MVARYIGSEVKSDLTSCEAITSPGSSLTNLMCSVNCCVFFMW